MGRLLTATDVCMYFGGVHAVDGISMHLDENEILGVIGPNGSGKTTFFNALTGIYIPTKGNFKLRDQDITGKPLHQMASFGISRTFQNLRIFRALSVEENVMIGEHIHVDCNLFDCVFRTPRFRRAEEATRQKALVALKQVGLENMATELAGGMSYGMQKRLELARALVADPELLLLDEPTAGMNDVEAEELMDLVSRIKKEQNISIILIEHNMKVMMKTAERIMAIDAGTKIAEGTPVEIQNNELVIRAYLGGNEE